MEDKKPIDYSRESQRGIEMSKITESQLVLDLLILRFHLMDINSQANELDNTLHGTAYSLSKLNKVLWELR